MGPIRTACRTPIALLVVAVGFVLLLAGWTQAAGAVWLLACALGIGNALLTRSAQAEGRG